MSQLTIAIISSIVATLIFAICLRSKKSIYLLLTLLISPIISLIFVNPKWAVMGWHEFMHASIVYNIMNGVVPPEDTLLAGYPLKYPWAHHSLVALLCQIANISPSLGITLLNILTLIISVVVIFKTAQLLHPTRQTGIFAVFLSFFGTSIFFLEPLNGRIHLDHRALPLHKFASANSNPLGFCLFLVCLFFLICLFARRGNSSINAISLGVSITAAAFLYPISWIGIVTSCICVCLGQAVITRGRNWQPILIVFLALFFGSVLAVPYLHNIGADKAATAEMSLNFHVKDRLHSLFIMSSFPLLILWLKRHYIEVFFKGKSSEVLTLCFGSIGLILLYIFVTIPLDCEYKFLMLIMAMISIFTAPFFEELYQEKSVLVELLIVLLILPTTFTFTGMFIQTQFTESVYTKGINIRHSNTRMDNLYSWITTKTPVDTVVVDSFLSVPALSRRSLYVGTDLRRKQDPNFAEFDGWAMDAKTMSNQVFGQDQEVVKRRLQNAIALLTPNPKDTVNAAAESIKQEFDKRQVIVVVRDPTIRMAFDENPRFAKTFEEHSVWVYTLKR